VKHNSDQKIFLGPSFQDLVGLSSSYTLNL
jgi:hypothetical protein